MKKLSVLSALVFITMILFSSSCTNEAAKIKHNGIVIEDTASSAIFLKGDSIKINPKKIIYSSTSNRICIPVNAKQDYCGCNTNSSDEFIKFKMQLLDAVERQNPDKVIVSWQFETLDLYHQVNNSKSEIGVLWVNFSPKISPQVTNKVESYHSVSNTVNMIKGGSLCETLHMTQYEALLFAKKYKLPYFFKKSVLYVKVQPGDKFHIVDGSWELQ